MQNEKVKILYVDDEDNNLVSFKATFRTHYEVLTAKSGSEAIQMLEKFDDIVVIITDQRMPNMTGVEFLSSIIEKYPLPTRILLTGYSDIQAIADAVNIGKIYNYVTKPWNEKELHQILLKAVSVYQSKINEIEYSERLERVNNQLEFLLRQKLLD
jgi:response regulator RpfG family c-di-GMP phosphodiesterase